MAKYIYFILSCFLLIGCGKSKDRHTPDSGAQLQSNPFDTDNKELLFAQLEIVVDSTIKVRSIDYHKNTIKGYLTWDSITHTLFSANLYGLKTDSELAKHRNCLTEYLNWHLRQIINTLTGDVEITKALHMESTLTDSLLGAQYKWLNSHFDATQDYLGSASNLKYYNIEYEMLELQNNNLKDLFQALTDSTYNNTVQYTISPEKLQTQYRHIESDRIPYYHDDSVYNEETDRLNFITEIGAWDKLMEQRFLIAGLLNGRVNAAYNVGTYYLLFNRLRQLKNEYEAYTIMTIDKQSLTLSDSCSYEELMAYPDFTTKWSKYLKQFE